MASAINTRTRLQDWIDQSPAPFVIAGPCSAESEKQVVETAIALKKSGMVSAFRAGVWKPRTRPGSFEGVGSAALEWLNAAKKETSLSIVTEVANASHVEEVLRNNVDMIWIGARTTVNPFYVQEIADALKGVNIPVLVKNPLHPEISLWVGALERLEKAGIKQLAAIHRGFYSPKPGIFRNEPHWELSFELRALAPELPILCDPSHIAGDRNLIEEVAQTAMDINFDGLMIESHPNPDTAKSDAKQQITPDHLIDLLRNLVIRKERPENPEAKNKLNAFRKDIEQLDAQIIELLKNRSEYIDAIGKLKKDNDMTAFQLKRWFDMLQNRKKLALEKELDQDMVHELFTVIHKFSVSQQIDQLKKEDQQA